MLVGVQEQAGRTLTERGFDMGLPKVLSLVGAALGLLGAGILAFSLNTVLMMLRTSADATETTVHQLVGSGNVPVFLGLDEHRRKAELNATKRTRWGFGLLVLSFALQVLGILLVP